MSTKPYVIVAGTDYSEQAVRALHTACQLALRYAPAELHVTHVCAAAAEEPTVPLIPLSGLATLPVLSLEEQRAALMAHLDGELAQHPELTASQVRIVAHVLTDAPSFGLTRLASELQADLIVVGTHGGHGLARWLLGSVAEGVVRQAPCPVLVIPPEPHKLAVPTIEPPCPRCVVARQSSSGTQLWCEQHRERHGRRHTYYQADRGAAETNMPLVVR